VPTKTAAAAKACTQPLAPAGGASTARPKAKKEYDDDEISFGDERPPSAKEEHSRSSRRCHHSGEETAA
jgi:hypothetical protein